MTNGADVLLEVVDQVHHSLRLGRSVTSPSLHFFKEGLVIFALVFLQHSLQALRKLVELVTLIDLRLSLTAFLH